MQRTLQLTQGEVLWHEQEPARTIAVVNKGKLAARAGHRVVGVMYRRMVLGESALLSLDGTPDVRTHVVYALEDGTEVTEYPATVLKEMVDSGNCEVAALVLRNLVGQTCRNWMIVSSANQGRAYLTAPLNNFTSALLESLAPLEAISTWADFMTAFRFLYGLRDLSESERERMVAPSVEKFEEIVQASHTMRWLFKEKNSATYLDAFISAEQERQAMLGQ